MQTIILIFALAGLALTLPASLLLWLHARGIYPVREVMGRFRRLPMLGQIVVIVVAVNLFVFGSTKTPTNDVPGGASSTNAPPPMLSAPRLSSPSPCGFTEEQLNAGFVLVDVGTNEIWDLAMPTNAAVVEKWRLRGAVDDWLMPGIGNFPYVVFADGRIQDAVRDPGFVAAPFNAVLGIVPETNWRLIADEDARSRVWYDVTESNSVRVTWQDALLLRDTNSPISVQAEFYEDGNFIYRYDLSRATNTLASCISNVLIGAWRNGSGETFALTCSLIPNPCSLSSLFFHALDPKDATDAGRDNDGLSAYAEIFVHKTDPSLFDTDGDGVGDGAEITAHLDPRSRDSDGDGLVDGSDPDPSVPTDLTDTNKDGVPDAYAKHWFGDTNTCFNLNERDETGFTLEGKMQAGINPTNAASSCKAASTNELVSWKLWDGFTMDRATNATNLVFERTIRIDRPSSWVNYFLSSSLDTAGGWSLQGMTLEWIDSDGVCGTATMSPSGDSLFLPLSTNNPHSVTIRLRAHSTYVRSAKPVYLIAYAPELKIEGGQTVDVGDGEKAYVYTDGSESAISVSIDRSKRPCKASLYPEERMLEGLADMSGVSGGTFSYEGDENGGIIHPRGPGIYALPEIASKTVAPAPRRMLLKSGPQADGPLVIVLLPSVWYGTDHCYGGVLLDSTSGTLVREYRYPLDSKCLWREWHHDPVGGFICNCTPDASSGIGESGYVRIEKKVEGDLITATIYVGNDAVWSGSAVHERIWDCNWDYTELEAVDECGDDCTDGCADGNCAGTEGHSLSSLKFRIPLGTPRKGQISGFAYFDTEMPMAITPAVFKYLIRPDSDTVVTTNGSSRTVECRDERGRSLSIVPYGHGVRVTINDANNALEHIWNIENANGDTNTVRFTKISRLDNVMEDWTYGYVQDADTGKWHWQATDNVAGIREELRTDDRINVDGSYTETRTKYNSLGDELGWTLTRSEVVGECESSVLRETHYEEYNGRNTIVRDATYWRDTGHRARNGRLKLMTANDRPWEYHEWDEYGRETLRVEQRNTSAVPSVFPSATSNGFANASALADVFLTTYDYTPLAGDDAATNDHSRVRCETRYVVVNGAVTMIGRIWHRFTHGWNDGRETMKDETIRAVSAASLFSDPQNARSYVVSYDENGEGTHLLLRGQLVEELDEEGIRTHRTYEVSGGFVTCTERKYNGTVQFPTYSVTVQDDTYGMTVRTATYLTDGDVLIGEERSVYDDQNRLRSTTYLDGTSITNSYSCCRKLWSRDREGRRTLRSGVTGRDHLYYAEEEVWLQDVASNGYKVTQHFVDAFGRETNTVTYVGSVPGEANDWQASDGKRMTETETWYAGTGYDESDSVDERGKYSYRDTSYGENYEYTYEHEGASDASGETRDDYDYWNGVRISQRSWNGKWTETRNWSEYDEFGRKIDFETTESSDCGCFTNSIVHYDFLGRTVMTETPSGVTTTAYDGNTSRVQESVFTADDVMRTTTHLYDVYGESVGTAVDGIASCREASYEETDGAWWKVTRESVIGSLTNSVTETRERLTGLVDGLRSETITVSAEGVTNVTRTVFDESTGLTTRTATSSIGGTRTDVLRYGLTLSSTSDEETTIYEYDALGHCIGRARCPTAPQAPQSGSSLVCAYEADVYNAVGDLIAQTTFTNDVEGVTETRTYDSFGRCIETVNALGETTTMAYDGAGNLIETAGATYPVKYEYDTAGRRTAMKTTQDGTTWDVTRWTYDPQTGKCLSKRYADGSEMTTTYTTDGLPAITTLPSGQWKTCEYDAQRRLIEQTSNDGRQDAAFEYDEFSRMTAVSNGVAQIGYALHRGGIATNETVEIGEGEYELTRSVDEFGRIAGRGLVGGERTTIAYTAANRVESVTSAAVGVTYLYTADGQDAGYLLTTGGTTMRREVTRDAYRKALVTSVSNFVNGVAIDATTYAHDALSRVTGRACRPRRAATDDPSDRVCETFGYNEKGEVTYASLNGWENNYSYDQIGNFLEVTQGTNTTVYAANALNQYTAAGDAALGYTADGGLTGFGGLTFAYDSGSRLTSVSSNGVVIAAYDYDAFDRRVRKVTPEAETMFVYDGWNLVLEEVAHTNGAVDRIEYVWGRDLSGTLDGAGGVGGLLYLKHNGAIYIPLYDANGSVIGYLDATGNLVVSFTYDAFGNELSSTTSVPCSLIPDPSLFHFRYSTKYLDPETGLYYYGYRFYSPVLARWLTRDPIEEQGGLNLYAFCGNNGINKYDARGLSESDVRQILNQVAPFFREINCPISADMFSYAYALKVQPPLDEAHGRFFPEMHIVSQSIKSSKGYANVMRKFMENIREGWSHNDWVSIPGISFASNDLDLFLAVHDGEIWAKGNVCRNKTTQRLHIKELTIKVDDDYNFHSRALNLNGGLTTLVLNMANNFVYEAQEYGLVKQYHWYAIFDEERTSF